MLAAALLAPLISGTVPVLSAASEDGGASLIEKRPVTHERGPVFSGLATNGTVPGGITALTIVEGDGQVLLYWKAPDSGGRAVVDYYIVFQNGNDIAHCTTTSIVISGLTNGESYRFMVAAHSSAGTGPLTTAYEATPRAAVHPMSVIAPVATVAAVAVAFVREAGEDRKRRIRSEHRRERLR